MATKNKSLILKFDVLEKSLESDFAFRYWVDRIGLFLISGVAMYCFLPFSNTEYLAFKLIITFVPLIILIIRKIFSKSELEIIQSNIIDELIFTDEPLKLIDSSGKEIFSVS